LVRELLESWTGQCFRLARSGSQSGKDAVSDSSSGISLAAEMKRYGQGSTLSRRELLGELSEVTQALPDLDLWVLATTTEIGDREAEGIKQQSEQSGLEILILDSRTDGSGYLNIFCAKYPDVIKNFCQRNCKDIKLEELDLSLKSIQSHINFEIWVKQLHELLDTAVFGYEGARRKAFQWLLKHIDNQIESMAVFLQDIGLNDKNRRPPITRTSLNAQFNTWWKNRNIDLKHAVLLGEEGTGKTWAVMAWLSSKFNGETGPILLPVTSIQLTGAFDLYELIVEILIKRCGKNETFWKKRLKGWMNHLEMGKPLFLLYMDGLNEKPNLAWGSLIMQSNSQAWYGSVVILITSRKEFYQTKVASPLLGIKNIEITGYDDAELQEELDRAGVSDSVIIPEELRSLIRKPRYCDLTLRFFPDLLGSGDLTVERLLYQDYKERAAKKLRQPVTDEDFNQILCGLATKYLHGTHNFAKADLSQIIPGADESGAILQEIIDGGLLVKTNQKAAPYRVESRRLIYGLGMLLADHVNNELHQSTEEYTSIAETWLEPQPDMELKASIVGTAVFISIMINDYPAKARQALLRIWIGSRNMTELQERAVSGYLEDCVQDVVKIADIFWSSSHDNGIAQERLANAFLRHRDNPKVKPILVNACKRWMSYVNINGHPFDRLSNNGNVDELKEDLFKRLGQKVVVGEIVIFYGRQFFIVEDDNLLRMARFAMLLISAGDRGSFIDSFFQWAISRRLMGKHSEFDEVAWVLRLANEDMWPEFAPEITGMAVSDSETLKKAAHLLLSCMENREATELREKYLRDLYPATMLQLEYEKDPYASIFALSRREDYEPCMARNDLNLWHIIMKLNKYLADPNIIAPDVFITRLNEAALKLPIAGYHGAFSSTVEDHQIDTYKPILARFAFQHLGNLMRSAVHTLDKRNEEGIRQLLLHLPEISIVLHEPEIVVLDRILKIYHQKANTWPKHADGGVMDREVLAECFGSLARIMHMEGDGIAAFIMDRPDKAFELESIGRWFRPLSQKTVDEYLYRFSTESSPVSQHRILWLLYSSKPILSDIHINKLIEWMESTDNALRYSVYQFTWLSGNQSLIDYILEKDYGPLHPEINRIDAWIVNIFCKYGHKLPFNILIQRLPLEWVAEIIYKNSCPSDDVRQFANLLDLAWQHVTQYKEIGDTTSISPQVEKHEKHGAIFSQYEEPSSDRSIRFISPCSTWQSCKMEGENGIRNILSQESNEDFVARQRAFYERIKFIIQQEGTRWRFCQFNSDVLGRVCQDYPEMVEKWINALSGDNFEKNLLFNCNGFYQSLCSALVKIEHPFGFVLWKKIYESPFRINFHDNHTGTDWMTYLPFSTLSFKAANNVATELLENCHSDIGLLELANAACAYGHRSWIIEKAQELIVRPQLWLRAKGLMFISLADIESEIDSLIQSSDVGGTWVEKLISQMKYLHERNLWARYWYNRFITVSDNDAAFACFQLFLKSIDRRCRLWIDELNGSANKAFKIDERRIKFRLTNNDQIKRAIKENEKELEDHFLTLKFEKGQIMPFA